MAMGAVHPRVLGYLGRALSLEFSAVQQYMTQASLMELWEMVIRPSGFVAKPWRKCSMPNASFSACLSWVSLLPHPS